MHRNSTDEDSFTWENISEDFALYSRTQKDMFKSITKKKVSKSHLFYLSIKYLHSASHGPAIILSALERGTHSISQDSGRKQMAHPNWLNRCELNNRYIYKGLSGI